MKTIPTLKMVLETYPKFPVPVEVAKLSVARS